MVAYFVQWVLDKELSKGQNKVKPKHEYWQYTTTIMCNNSKEAMAAFELLFTYYYINRFKDTSYTLVDGVITLHRMKLDSRNFSISWLYTEGMRQPLYLPDVKNSVLFVSGRNSGYYKLFSD